MSDTESNASSDASTVEPGSAFELDDMDEFLYYILEVENEDMRGLIQREGFTSFKAVLRKDEKWVSETRNYIRKSPTADPQARDMTSEQALNLWKAILWAKYAYITQRPLEFNLATRRSMERVYEWYKDLEAELPDTSVATFSSSLNKRTWFESIESYLQAKKGAAGFPIKYVVSTTGAVDRHNPPAMPVRKDDFKDDLAKRGRHRGVFWSMDNNMVWRLLEQKCRGTDAWSTIAAYEPTANGTGAYRALRNHYMGDDVKKVLRTEADTIIRHTKFDGKSRNYTLEKHINRFRQAFIDLGPDNQPTEERKVEWFMDAWQVPGKDHLSANVLTLPEYSGSFENTCNYLMKMMAANETKSTSLPSASRSVAAMGSDKTSKSGSKRKFNSSSKYKGNSKKAKKDKGKKDRPKAKEKYDSADPAAYVTSDVWKKMTKEEQQAAREKRREQGIPVRNVSGITTHRNVSSASASVRIGEESEQLSFHSDESPKETGAHTSVRVATLEQIKPTQKPPRKGPNKETQMSDRAMLEMLQKQIEELSKRVE